MSKELYQKDLNPELLEKVLANSKVRFHNVLLSKPRSSYGKASLNSLAKSCFYVSLSRIANMKVLDLDIVDCPDFSNGCFNEDDLLPAIDAICFNYNRDNPANPFQLDLSKYENIGRVSVTEILNSLPK